MTIDLLDLPDEIIELILKNLNLYSLVTCKLVNSHINSIIKKEKLIQEKENKLFDLRNFPNIKKFNSIREIFKRNNKLFVLFDEKGITCKQYIEIDLIDNYYKIQYVKSSFVILITLDKIYRFKECKTDDEVEVNIWQYKYSKDLKKIFFDNYDSLYLFHNSSLVCQDFRISKTIIYSRILYYSDKFILSLCVKNSLFNRGVLFTSKHIIYLIDFSDDDNWRLEENADNFLANKNIDNILDNLILNLNNQIYDKNDQYLDKIIEIYDREK